LLARGRRRRRASSSRRRRRARARRSEASNSGQVGSNQSAWKEKQQQQHRQQHEHQPSHAGFYLTSGQTGAPRKRRVGRPVGPSAVSRYCQFSFRLQAESITQGEPLHLARIMYTRRRAFARAVAPLPRAAWQRHSRRGRAPGAQLRAAPFHGGAHGTRQSS
jgi:hypothetical protein